jgi:hypothetical protein
VAVPTKEFPRQLREKLRLPVEGPAVGMRSCCEPCRGQAAGECRGEGEPELDRRLAKSGLTKLCFHGQSAQIDEGRSPAKPDPGIIDDNYVNRERASAGTDGDKRPQRCSEGRRAAPFANQLSDTGPSSLIAATAYYLRSLKSRSAFPPSTASFSPAVRNKQCLRT